MANFTPWSALAGGALIGLAATLFLWSHGRVAGVSNILAGLLTRGRERPIRLVFLAGLVAAGGVLALLTPGLFPASAGSVGVSIGAGLAVGAGTRWANGCTSGHGVCGLSRRSVRSLVATLTFIATGAATVLVVRLAGG